MELSTQQKGSITEYRIISRLIELGFNVFKSCTEFSRVDIIVEHDSKLYKVQCKTGKLVNGVIRVNIHSVNNLTHESKSYKGQVDYFGVYCFETNKCYMVPEKICSKHGLYLRINIPLSNQKAGIHYANEYEL